VELRETIASRRSAREYRKDPVPCELIEDLLQRASAAPSACNRRGWRFILVDKRPDLDWLYRNGGSAVLRSAGQALVVCYQRKSDNDEWQDNLQSAAAVIAFFQLLAHESGVGSCWICHLPPKEEVANYFSIPSTYLPVAVVSFGYYKQVLSTRDADGQQGQRILARGRWDFADETEARLTISFFCRKVLRKLYYLIPFRTHLRSWAGRYEKKFDL
jgi:nitroreductase